MALFHVGFISYTLRREVDINVVIPTCTIPEAMGMNGAPTHKHKAPFPVLYLLHGFGNNYSVWGRYTNVERYSEERQIAVVMISGENKWYMNQPDGKDRFHVGINTLTFCLRSCRSLFRRISRYQTAGKIPILPDCRWAAWARCCIR